MNVFETIINFFSPTAALKRALARQSLEVIAKSERAYDAGGYSRRTKNWYAPQTSATTENAQALRILRNRARELVRNNCWASKAVNVVANNVVGSGMRASFAPKMDTTSGKKQAEKLKFAWQDWANSTDCDFDENLNLYGLQNLIMRTVVECGECLILKYVEGDELAKNYRLKLRLLEGDFIDTSKHDGLLGAPNADYNFYGVRLSAAGKRLGVWIYDRHPENGADTSKLYTMDKIIHVYEKMRIGQHRGVPMGVSAFIRMRDMNEYEDAQLMRQKIAACFSLFVHNAGGAGVLAGKQQGQPSELERVEPGIIQYLAPGEDISFATPPPIEGFAEYSRQVLRGIAGAYNITYESLTSDYSQVNFSSGKLSAIEQDKNTAKLQRDVLGVALEKIYLWWAEVVGIKEGVTKAGSIRVEWTTPKREMIDPVKETNALRLMQLAGMKSPQEVSREMGYDYEDTLREIQDANAMRDRLKIVVDTDARQVLNKNAPIETNNSASGAN